MPWKMVLVLPPMSCAAVPAKVTVKALARKLPLLVQSPSIVITRPNCTCAPGRMVRWWNCVRTVPAMICVAPVPPKNTRKPLARKPPSLVQLPARYTFESSVTDVGLLNRMSKKRVLRPVKMVWAAVPLKYTR